MIQELELKNFRKHTNKTLTFTGGLNILRGANEQGKTTILESILYAMFGARSLREPLSEVVTTGQPENSLKVSLKFQLDGVDYRIVRGSSGAELTYGTQSVTGQTGVKVFMENLLRVNADTACKLLFANQDSVRGILADGGNSSSNALVESLSGLSLIEELVDKVQAQLPGGNTGEIERRIQNAKDKVAETPTAPTSAALDEANAKLAEALQNLDLAERAVPADQDVTKAQGAVTAFNAATARISKIRSLLAVSVTDPGVTRAQIDQALQARADARENSRLWKEYTKAFPDGGPVLEGYTYEAFLVMAAKKAEEVKELEAKLQQVKFDLKAAELKRINEKTCAFCKKDLTDVPEVIAANAASDSQVAAYRQEGKSLFSAWEDEKRALQNITIRQAAYAAIRLAANPEYWELSDTVPPVPTWKGRIPVAPDTGPSWDVDADLRKLNAYEVELAKHTALKQELSELEWTTVPVDAELVFLAEAHAAKQNLVAAQTNHLNARLARDLASSEYLHAVQAYNKDCAAIEESRLAIAELETTRNEMLENNELVKRLRAIRPQVAAQLWGTVLGSISRYFTQIRGTPSVVTRDADSFKVNGKGIAGLSGSTLDALGLAIRMSLSKLFLPNVPFLFLDESFHGADDTRETNGISTLAAAGFGQTILVTHSDVPEAFADNLIVLE